MTTAKITIQDWEIPETLKKIEQNTQRANELLLENKSLFTKVLNAQESLKKTCEVITAVAKSQM